MDGFFLLGGGCFKYNFLQSFMSRICLTTNFVPNVPNFCFYFESYRRTKEWDGGWELETTWWTISERLCFPFTSRSFFSGVREIIWGCRAYEINFEVRAVERGHDWKVVHITMSKDYFLRGKSRCLKHRMCWNLNKMLRMTITDC